jgi:hypothetical protein
VEDNAKNKVVLQAIEVLRAPKHLSMAGLMRHGEAQTEGHDAYAGMAGEGCWRDVPGMDILNMKSTERDGSFR